MMQITGVIIALVLGVIGGNGAVYAFNHMPAQWLCDYGEVPEEDKLQRQRINSRPWRRFFICTAGYGGHVAPYNYIYSRCQIYDNTRPGGYHPCGMRSGLCQLPQQSY